MAIITFKSNERKETGQTLSLVAVATQMAVEHSYKILIVSTNFKDQTLENCFWELDRLNKPIMANQRVNIGVDSGVEGLIKVLASNKTSNDIVRNYSKTVLRDRLDILLSPVTEDYNEYSQICREYPEILRIADRYYDLIFVDLSGRMDERNTEDIINVSDVIVVNLTQRLKTINDFVELRENNDFYKRKNIILLMGRYDAHSKYNIKNVTRYMKERKEILAIPYNTLYFEACSEGKAIDFFLRLKNLDENDRNRLFVNEANRADDAIIYKLQELQMKI
jgi:MinD-like ATPase involved in chromosome partitioning or flagellar assembly